jgi:hypothetical protein
VLNEVRHEDISIAKLSNTPEMRIGGVEAWFHAFLNSTHDGG